ncbi:hypothetical protein B0J13DRAFT_518125 [Dactylonectria estremocensis]|uniref:Uncharacterized protein n=1 Tax=Dactylonectria estremocensis TaxID=1079267 RepID=A0A9P9FL14_9HYPO|nr:hypothetical protein B0J13DRAFT_518125 [Dactylonectria estremocensis]
MYVSSLALCGLDEHTKVPVNLVPHAESASVGEAIRVGSQLEVSQPSERTEWSYDRTQTKRTKKNDASACCLSQINFWAPPQARALSRPPITSPGPSRCVTGVNGAGQSCRSAGLRSVLGPALKGGRRPGCLVVLGRAAFTQRQKDESNERDRPTDHSKTDTHSSLRKAGGQGTPRGGVSPATSVGFSEHTEDAKEGTTHTVGIAYQAAAGAPNQRAWLYQTSLPESHRPKIRSCEPAIPLSVLSIPVAPDQ